MKLDYFCKKKEFETLENSAAKMYPSISYSLERERLVENFIFFTADHPSDYLTLWMTK